MSFVTRFVCLFLKQNSLGVPIQSSATESGAFDSCCLSECAGVKSSPFLKRFKRQELKGSAAGICEEIR